MGIEITSEDIYCRICGESWNIYGIFHGNMSDKQIEMFLSGFGCPCCNQDYLRTVLCELNKEVVNRICGEK